MQQLKAQAEQKGYAWIDWNVCAEDATASHPNAARSCAMSRTMPKTSRFVLF